MNKTFWALKIIFFAVFLLPGPAFSMGFGDFKDHPIFPRMPNYSPNGYVVTSSPTPAEVILRDKTLSLQDGSVWEIRYTGEQPANRAEIFAHYRKITEKFKGKVLQEDVDRIVMSLRHEDRDIWLEIFSEEEQAWAYKIMIIDGAVLKSETPLKAANVWSLNSLNLSGPRAEFSADISIFKKGSGTVRQKGKIYRAPGLERLEEEISGGRATEIEHKDMKMVWRLLPDEQKYLERSSSVFSEDSVLSAIRDIRGRIANKIVLGEELADGVKTTKYKVNIEYDAMRYHEAAIWVAEGEILKKLEIYHLDEKGDNYVYSDPWIKMELHNLKIGKVDRKVFELPAGYVKTYLDLSQKQVTLTNAKYGFRLAYPSNWRAVKAVMSIAYTDMEALKKGDVKTSFSYSSTEEPQNWNHLTFDNITPSARITLSLTVMPADAAYEDFINAYYGPRMADKKEFYLSGIKGYSFTSALYGAKVKQVVFPHKGSHYELTYSVMTERDFERYEEAFNMILKSFKIE